MLNGKNIFFEGTIAFFKDNLYHREDGPAIEYPDGTKYWYLNGKHLPCKTQEEFIRLMKLKAFW